MGNMVSSEYFKEDISGCEGLTFLMNPLTRLSVLS